jgi:hypothetical protein
MTDGESAQGPGGLDGRFLAELDAVLAPADAQARRYPGEPASRQPVHTVYVPAMMFRARTPAAWGAAALALLDEHAATGERLAAATGLEPESAGAILPRVRAKLGTQPIEDLRVDFEDGYGNQGDDTEDDAARAAGAVLAGFTGDEHAPFLTGLRIKGLQPATRRRGLRTLDLLVRAATEAGGLPERFVVTLPKVAHVAEVEAGVRICEHLEKTYGLAAGAVRFELQIEVPQAVVGPTGAATVAQLIHATQGRCEGLHYGTYDFSAAAGVVAGEQSLEHALADHAKAVMQLAAAQTGVRVSDGSTNVVPVGTAAQVSAAWQLHARLVVRSLRRALYQGWDLHPGHLVTRYAATYQFHREQLGLSADRLRDYTQKAASGVLDEPATAQALATAVLRGLDCGATDEPEVTTACSLTRPALLALARRA